MKKITLLFLLIPIIGISQIKKVEEIESTSLGKIPKKGAMIAEIRKFQDDNYAFYYKNMEYESIVDYKYFSFKDIDNAFDNLYETIIKGFEKAPEEPIILELPSSVLHLYFKKKSRKKIVLMIFNIDNKNNDSSHTAFLSMSDINILFGKK